MMNQSYDGRLLLVSCFSSYFCLYLVVVAVIAGCVQF